VTAKKGIPWDEYAHLLGTVQDVDLAKELGVNPSNVTRQRTKRNIPPFSSWSGPATAAARPAPPVSNPEPPVYNRAPSCCQSPVSVDDCLDDAVDKFAALGPVPGTPEPSNGVQRVVFFGDSHHPYEDKRAWRCFLRAAEVFAPDILVCVGDLCDEYSLSSYTADPTRVLKWEDELIAYNEALDQLDAIGAGRKIFCGGNHESRLPRYLAKRAPKLYGVTTTAEVLRLADRCWEWVEYGQSIMVGKVMITHDLDRYGIYAVRHALRDAGTNVVIGHVHRMCTWYEGSMSGDNQVAASFGWLGGVEHATYRHRVRAERDWQLGFGIGYLEPCGTMHMQAVPILDGRCVIEGRLVTA